MFYAPPVAVVSGTKLGQLDPNQASRLLHDETHTLSFATYSPYAALNLSSPESFSLLDNLDGPPNNKRIAIETTKDGHCIWRWVPCAKMHPNVTDEGVWPRLVNYRGADVLFDLAQWEIHKLDPAFTCYIPPPPGPPEIRERVLVPAPKYTPPISTMNINTSSSSTTSTLPDRSTPPRGTFRQPTPPLTPSKRTHDDRGSTSSCSSDGLKTPPSKRYRTTVQDESELGANLEDLESMTVDRQAPPPYKSHTAYGTSDPNITDSTPPTVPLDSEDVMDQDSVKPEDNEADTIRHSRKRKMSPFCDRQNQREIPTRPCRPHRSNTYPKRSRAKSPDEVKAIDRGIRGISAKYSKLRSERHQRRKEERNEALHQAFMTRMVLEDPVPSSDWDWEAPRPSSFGLAQSKAESEPVPEPSTAGSKLSEEAQRQRDLEESINKMQELNKDDIFRLKREAEEAALAREEQRKRREKDEARKKAEDEKQRTAAERAAREEQASEAWREHARRRFVEHQRTQQRRRLYSFSSWTTIDAFERYRKLCKEFDSRSMTNKNVSPASFSDLPWPVCTRPQIMTLNDINFDSVQHFFERVSTLLHPAEYWDMVDKSHKRFHPDRWRNRANLSKVKDDGERYCLEFAGQTVSQVVTDIRDRLKETRVG